MPLLLSISLASLIIYSTFVYIRKEAVSIGEALVVIIPMVGFTMFVYSLGFAIGVTGMIENSANTIIMTIAATRKNKNIYFSLMYSIFTIIIVLLAGNLAGAMLTLVYFVSPGFIELGRSGIMDSLVMSTIYQTITFTTAFTVSRKLGHSFHARIGTLDAHMQGKLVSLILPRAFITMGVFFVVVFLRYIPGAESMLILAYTLSLSIIFIYLVFAIFAFTDSLRKDIELTHKNELLHNLEVYTKDVERMANEMRRFRHDNANMLLPLQEYINNSDISGMQLYMRQYMTAFNDASKVMDAQLDILKGIKTIELKSLVSAKLMYALQIGINVHIEVPKDVEIVELYNKLDLCRIVGIFLDNAIDACCGVEGAEIRFMTMPDDQHILFVFKNTCITSPDIARLDDEGYTTKQGQRGLGLYTARQLIERNHKLSLSTIVESGHFIQELIVLPGE